jgi:transposase
LLKSSQKHPVPHRNAVRRLTEKFRETGSVLDAERIGRAFKLNDKKLMEISGSMLRCTSKSLRKLAQTKDIGLATEHKEVREKLSLSLHTK